MSLVCFVAFFSQRFLSTQFFAGVVNITQNVFYSLFQELNLLNFDILLFYRSFIIFSLFFLVILVYRNSFYLFLNACCFEEKLIECQFLCFIWSKYCFIELKTFNINQASISFVVVAFYQSFQGWFILHSNLILTTTNRKKREKPRLKLIMKIPQVGISK